MAKTTSRIHLDLRYFEDAQAYLRSLPPEHFMEATAQSTQRKITVESLDLVQAARSDVHVFSELLVQYPKSNDKIGHVVPDNMVVIHDGPLTPETSYVIELQPAKPFWMLEYVSKNTKRKDYEENMVKYEKILKVPYYLIFYPDNQELSLFHYPKHKKGYSSVLANENERHSIPELELEVAILDGWVRFWFRGELLPLPADLQRDVTALRKQLQAANRRADEAERQIQEERRRRLAAEEAVAQMRAEIETLRRRRNGA
jgi:Uma2 family endonuclease